MLYLIEEPHLIRPQNWFCMARITKLKEVPLTFTECVIRLFMWRYEAKFK